MQSLSECSQDAFIFHFICVPHPSVSKVTAKIAILVDKYSFQLVRDQGFSLLCCFKYSLRSIYYAQPILQPLLCDREGYEVSLQSYVKLAIGQFGQKNLKFGTKAFVKRSDNKVIDYFLCKIYG